MNHPCDRLPVTYLQGQTDGNAISLLIHVQPKSSRTRVTGLHGKALKLCITAPPVDGKANAQVIEFFAKLFKIPKAAVTIANGETSRDKRLVLAGLSMAQAESVLQPLLTRRFFHEAH